MASDYHIDNTGLEDNTQDRVAMRVEGGVMEKGIQIAQGCGVEFAFYSKHPEKPIAGVRELSQSVK